MLSERNVETIDILPTVADVLDLPLPWPADGQSAIDSGLPERPAKFSLGAAGEDGFARKPWDVEALRAGRAQSLARKLRVFGSGARPDGLFRIGSRPDLLGRRVSEMTVAGATVAAPATDIELDEAWAYGEVDPEGPFLPVHVTGQARFAQPRDAPAELAIAVNDTVEALTRTFGHDGDGARFTAMVREEALVAGYNRVEVFEIRDRGKAAALVPTRQSSGESYTLAGTPGEEALRSADGSRLPLIKGHVRGNFDFRRGPRGSELAGTAIGAGRQPAERLLVFVGGRLAMVSESGLAPSHRTKLMEPWRREASFRFRVPDALVEDSEIRLVAILGDAASEIAQRVLAPREVKPRAHKIARKMPASRRSEARGTAGGRDRDPRTGGASTEAPNSDGLIFADGFESGGTGAWKEKR